MSSNTALKHSDHQVYVICDRHDSAQRRFITGRLERESKRFSFLPEVADPVLSKAWELGVKDHIRSARVIVCLIGERSWRQRSVSRELNFAYSAGKTVIGIRINHHSQVPVPSQLVDRDALIYRFNAPQVARILEQCFTQRGLILV